MFAKARFCFSDGVSMRSWLLCCCIVLACDCCASTAKSCGPGCFSQAELAPAGSGEYYYRGLWKIYEARLYLPVGVGPDSALLDVPKRLELTYARAFSGEQIREAGMGILRRLYSPEKLQGLQAQIDALHNLYGAVKKGDRYELEYRPGVGTELRLNGVTLGTVGGAEFAETYFAIWLGRHRWQGGLWEKFQKSWSQRPHGKTSLHPFYPWKGDLLRHASAVCRRMSVNRGCRKITGDDLVGWLG